ncbi:MAG: major capsid protein [Desulfuromonadaceae bacterium]|nr:major capsid protein [Desulfuromonadaceae bacterium]
MFKRLQSIALAAMVVCMSALSSFAAMSPADVTATTTGISDSLTLFYTIGGTILVVLAGIWGFRKITGLLGK